MFWRCLNSVEMGSWDEVVVHLNHSACIKLLDNQDMPFTQHLAKERNILIPVFQDSEILIPVFPHSQGCKSDQLE